MNLPTLEQLYAYLEKNQDDFTTANSHWTQHRLSNDKFSVMFTGRSLELSCGGHSYYLTGDNAQLYNYLSLVKCSDEPLKELVPFLQLHEKLKERDNIRYNRRRELVADQISNIILRGL